MVPRIPEIDFIKDTFTIQFKQAKNKGAKVQIGRLGRVKILKIQGKDWLRGLKPIFPK
jgi:hypothetical protein